MDAIVLGSVDALRIFLQILGEVWPVGAAVIVVGGVRYLRTRV